MAEYIERSDAASFFENSKQTMWHKDDIAATISSKKNIPDADVVEVVRCGECKYFGKELRKRKCFSELTNFLT